MQPTASFSKRCCQAGARGLLRRFVAFRNRYWFSEVTRKPQGGDLADWASFNPNQGGPVGDSYGEPLLNGADLVSQVDIEEMNVLGWQIATPTVSQGSRRARERPVRQAPLSAVGDSDGT